MFRRKSSKKKSDQDGSFVSYTDSSVDDDQHSNGEGDSKPADSIPSRKISTKEEDVTEILKDILSVPVAPEIKFTNELQEDPLTIISPYIPTLFKLLEWTVIFLMGFIGFSYAWILCFTLAYHGYVSNKRQKKILTQTASNTSRHEKDILQDCLQKESLPSWVVFPDTDRVEWINIILKKVWPNIGKLVQDIAKKLVEPKINEILKRISLRGINLEALSNFKLKDVQLGSIPARVGGIRVYDRNTARQEIIMDLEIIYGGDAEVKFSVQAMSCLINQIFFRGTVRVVIKPLLDVIPLFGGLEIYFIDAPTIDYNLGGMANFAEIPGISDMIRSVIDNIVKRGFVWPNRFSFFFPLSAVDSLQDQSFCMSTPEAVLCVEVVEGKDLVKKDKLIIGGKSDPYVVMSIGEMKVSFKDQYIDCNVNPVWNYQVDFPIEESSGQHLKLEVFDYDAGTEDDFMGRTSVDISEAVNSKNSFYESWKDLEDVKHGSILVKAYWRPVSSHENEGLGTVISVFIDSCANLSSSKSSTLLSQCEVRVCSSDATRSSSQRKGSAISKQGDFLTKPRGPTDSPVFGEGYNFVSANPGSDSIFLMVMESKTSNVLGKASVKVAYLASLPDRQFSRMVWPLEGANSQDASITISAKMFKY